MAEEEKTQSAFDTFSKMGAVMGQAKLSQEKGMGGFEDYTPNLEDIEKGYDLALKIQKNLKAKVNKNKEATQKLLDQFPGGISVPKMDEQLDGLVSNFLTEQRGIYETNAKIEGQGAKAEGYDVAVGTNNQIDRNVIAVNNDLEAFANLRTELLKEVGGVTEDENGEISYDKPSEYAKGTTKQQEENLYNLTSGDYESLKPEITYNDKGDARLTILDAKGNRVKKKEVTKTEDTVTKFKVKDNKDEPAKVKTRKRGGTGIGAAIKSKLADRKARRAKQNA